MLASTVSLSAVHSMVEHITLLLTGFSIISAAILLLAYLFFLDDMEKTKIGLVSCTILLAALTGLQLYHLQFLLGDTEPFDQPLYLALLLTAPPSFYFFSREILLPESHLSPGMLVHFLPLIASAFLPTAIIAPFAFAVGAGYAIWLARVVYGMRRQSHRFRFEMFFFGLFALLAVMVLILGAMIPYINPSLFYLTYANFTGIAFVLIVAALIIFPEILNDITEAASATYSTSTLGDVDVESALARLDELMQNDKIYQNENLSLRLLAEAMNLSSHQLSELINTRLGLGFSRYIREQRVAEAKRLLTQDQRSSVLAISMTTGFKSQSSFYAAFKELTGEAPGNYRKRTLSTRQSS